MVKDGSRHAGTSRSVTDWEDAALKAIAAEGLAALSIPELARSLGVTKGSFYWHFRRLDDLIEAALRRWEEADGQALEALQRVPEPRQRLVAMFREAMQPRQALSLYIALASSPDPNAIATLRRINQRRMKLLVGAYSALGFPRDDARKQALIAYTAYVGALHLRQQRAAGLTTESGLAAYVRHAEDVLIPAS